MARKRPETCFFCDEAPCICKKQKASDKRTKASVEVKTVETITPIDNIGGGLTSEPVRTVRKITAVHLPEYAVPVVPSVPVKPVAPLVHKIERTDDELIETLAIQTLVASSLVTLDANPHVAEIANTSLSPLEKVRAWKLRVDN